MAFFAEDVFGIQFAVSDEGFGQFDPETAELTPVADTLEGWFEAICGDPDFYTGEPVLGSWTENGRTLEVGHRLIPKKLFTLGGEFVASNVVSKPDVEGMRLRAQFWEATKDIPDGQQVVFRIDE